MEGFSCTYGFSARTLTPRRGNRRHCSRPTGQTARPYIAQGWIVTDPVALAELGDIPPGEAVIEIPADVLRFAEEVR
jgi:hypothetical protein